MTEGISKETLLAINPWDYDDQQDLLNAILELCTELDPWLPIDENTPKDKEILMYFTGGVKVVTRWFTTSKGGYWFTGNDDYIGQPTHYKLLPEDLK